MKVRRTPRNHAHPLLPSVNLLSASAFAGLATRKLRVRFLVAGAVLVVLVLASSTAQHLRVSDAEQALAIEQGETSRLGSENQALASVRTFVNGVALQKETVAETMASEVFTSKVLDALLVATPPGLEVETLTLTVAAAQAVTAQGAVAAPVTSPCPGPDPFSTRKVIGCVTLTGTADDRATVGELVIRLGGVNLFVEPFISTTTNADSASVTFSGSVGLSRAAFSRRYGVPTVPVDPVDPVDPADPVAAGVSQ